MVLNSFGKEFVVGVEEIEYYPHYDFVNNKNNYTKELLELFAKKHGYLFKFEPLPVNRLFHYFITKRLDFKYPDHPEWQPDTKKNSRIYYSKPVVKILGGTFVLPQNKGKGINSFRSLGLVLGFTPVHWRNLLRSKDIKCVKSNDLRMILKQVLMGRIDGADLELSVAKYHLDRMKRPGTLVLDPSLPYVVIPFFLSTIKHPGIIKEFNRFLVQEKTVVDRLKSKYGILDATRSLRLAQQ